MSSSDGASEVYGKLLLLEKMGYPLWYPDLDENLSREYRDQGVRIGDVGSITGAGQFDFQFNVHDENWALDGFHPWPPQDTSFFPNMRDAGAVITRGEVTEMKYKVDASLSLPASASIGPGVEITCSTKESAILVLPDGASDTNLKKPEKFLNSLSADVALQWLHATESSSLTLVTGCVKSRSWGVASVTNASRQAFVSLNFSAAQVGGQFTGSYSWQSSSGGHHRDGPRPPSDKQNQCLFLRGFKMSSRKNLMPGSKRVEITDISGSKMPDLKKRKGRGNRLSGSSHSSTSETSKGSLRNQNAPADAEEQESVDGEEVFIEELADISQPYHPLDVINNHLLDVFPNARVAVTHDDDWCALIEEADERFPDDDELLRRLRQKYNPILKSGGLARLIPHETPDKHLKHASVSALSFGSSMVSRPSELPSQQRRHQHSAHDINRPILQVQTQVSFPPKKQKEVGRMPRTTRNPALPRINTKVSPVKNKSKPTPWDVIDTMRYHCHPELEDRSPDSGGSWIRRDKTPRTEFTAGKQNGSEARWTSKSQGTPLSGIFYMFLGSAVVNTSPSPNHDADQNSAQPPPESDIIEETVHLFDSPPHPTSLFSSSARSSSEQATVAEIQGTVDTVTFSPPTSLQITKPDKLGHLRCSSEKIASQFCMDGKELLPPLSSPIPSVVDLPLTIFSNAGPSTPECSTSSPVVNGITIPDNIHDDETKQLQQQTLSSPPLGTDMSTTNNQSVTAKDQSLFANIGRADSEVANGDSLVPMLDEGHVLRPEQTYVCSQEPENLMTTSIPEFESKQEATGNVGEQLEETSELPVFDVVLDPLIPKSQNSTAGESSESPPLANTGGINLDAPPSSITHPESPILKATSHPTSFAGTYQLTSQSDFDIAISSAVTASSASTACLAGPKIASSNTGADSAQAGQLTSSGKRRLKKARQEEGRKGTDKINNNDTGPPSSQSDLSNSSSRELDSSSSNSGKGDSSGMQHPTIASNTNDGMLLASRKTPNPAYCASATFGQGRQASSTITSSDECKSGSAHASMGALAAGKTVRSDSFTQISQLDLLAPVVPTGTLVDLRDWSEQNNVPVFSVFSSSSSTDLSLVAPHQTADGSSPRLPPLPESHSDFDNIFDFLPRDRGDTRTDSIAVPPPDLINTFKPRDSDPKIIVSPTRRSFPSVQDFERTGRVIMPQDDITRARAASLRFRNQKLKEECDHWRQQHDELKRKNHELEEKYKNLEKGLANLAAAGAEWLPFS